MTVLIIAGLVVAGCRPTPLPTPVETRPLPYDVEVYGDLENLDPDGQVVIYWYQHSHGRQEILQAMIDEFNATNRWDITVQGEYAGSCDEIYDKFLAGIPLGRIPDISSTYPHQAAAYADRGALVELTPYIESEEWGLTEGDLNDFFPFVIPSGYLPQFEGLYSLPPDRSIDILYYNEDWLHELGYDYPPQTWDEFREMACAASDPEAGTYGYEFSIDTSTFTDWVFSRGGQMLDDDAAIYTFGDRAGLEALTFLQELSGEVCALREMKPHGGRADFGVGKVLFTIDSSSELSYYRRAVADGAGFNWSITTLPTSLDRPKVTAYGVNLSISRSMPEKQLAAWLFIRWLTEPEQQARWARASDYLPVRRSTADLLQDYFDEHPLYAEAFDLLDYDVVVEPRVAGYDECRDAIGEMLNAVANGEDPATWLADTVEECNASLESG